jgi:hypothetical protein
MAITVMILGESGTGKSTAIRTLPVDNTLIINVLGKPLPFKGSAKFKTWTTDQAQQIVATLDKVNKKREEIKYIVIDDYQYLMSNEYMSSLLEKGSKDSEFQKYKSIGYNAWSVIRKAQSMRPGIVVFFLSHIDTDQNGRQKCKTIGKLLDEKITLEGMFTVVLNTEMQDTGDGWKYSFATQNNGHNSSKSPMGMFEQRIIDNDLNLVANAIEQYYQ